VDYMIPRKDYSITKNTIVCQKLFAAEFIVKLTLLVGLMVLLYATSKANFVRFVSR
jgi:hypothetical protein